VFTLETTGNGDKQNARYHSFRTDHKK